MPVESKKVTVCICSRCGHKWIPKTALKEPDKLPLRCGSPKCNTPYWDVPRKTEQGL